MFSFHYSISYQLLNASLHCMPNFHICSNAPLNVRVVSIIIIIMYICKQTINSMHGSDATNYYCIVCKRFLFWQYKKKKTFIAFGSTKVLCNVFFWHRNVFYSKFSNNIILINYEIKINLLPISFCMHALQPVYVFARFRRNSAHVVKLGI